MAQKFNTDSVLISIHGVLMVLILLFQRYQTLGTEVFLAMSGDATCRGIRSPRDGPVVMELSQGMHR